MKTTLVLAMTADGKIADATKSPPTFSSDRDSAHLEAQMALADAILVGSGTLGDGGSAVLVNKPALIQSRIDRGKPAQPPQIICSRSGKIDPQLPFFSQPIDRWLLTTTTGATDWHERDSFSQILVCETPDGKDIDWQVVKIKLAELNLEHICFLGGSELAASLFAAGFIDELWLTVCPVIYGGTASPTPVSGAGFTPDSAPKLTLLNVDAIAGELFLHYQVQK
ncbi:RibD family protein [Chamaesiphon sp. VAR_48_metabat_403]|uniref:RibD family protein n=1 Tax=Chamaesiphon sp. VAR_48_metabat_403 TaxID=2964700 RepID=UPI00286E2649|nr:RibD family protein [Chamaesiphon sp. VAR_48_metabat_403]